MFLAVVFLVRTAGSVDLAAVGDVMLGRGIQSAIKRYGPAYPFAQVRGFLKRQDLFYVNLEGPITSLPTEMKKPFLLPAAPGEEKVFAGLPKTVVSLANNHTLDCGREGLRQTMAALRSCRVAYCGAYWDKRSRFPPSIFEINGVKVAFIGFSDFPETVAGGSPGVGYFDAAGLAASIKASRRLADVVVVAAHWGIEDDPLPSDRQKQEAKELAADGADLILGCHPHVVQAGEWLQGQAGRRCYVVYSMGDFVFDTIRPSQKKTGIWMFRLTKNGVERVALKHARISNGRPAF